MDALQVTFASAKWEVILGRSLKYGKMGKLEVNNDFY